MWMGDVLKKIVNDNISDSWRKSVKFSAAIAFCDLTCRLAQSSVFK